MATDPYQRLGVGKDASQEDIQKAYRRLAKTLHPDLNPGNRQAEEKFKDVSAAYDLLGDPEKRARFDKGEIDASGAERPQQRYYRDFAESGEAHAYANDAGFADFMDADILSELFRRGGRGNVRMRGQDLRYRLAVDFLDAVRGAVREIQLPNGSELKLAIPPGTRDGQVLRLRGKGEPGLNEGPPGDALIQIEVRPHSVFKVDGDDIRLDLPISLSEAVLGGKVRVPTTDGAVMLSVPKGSSSGKVLRLKGKGLPRGDGGRGDQYVTLRIMLPDAADADLERFVSTWPAGKAHNPRGAMVDQ